MRYAITVIFEVEALVELDEESYAKSFTAGFSRAYGLEVKNASAHINTIALTTTNDLN